MSRPISEIAKDIESTWTNVNFAARPYLSAMRHITSIDELYGYDTARSVVSYFLSNARTYRGDDARFFKAELKAILGGAI